MVRRNEHKQTNVWQIALERQAGPFNSEAVAWINFTLWLQKFSD